MAYDCQVPVITSTFDISGSDAFLSVTERTWSELVLKYILLRRYRIYWSIFARFGNLPLGCCMICGERHIDNDFLDIEPTLPGQASGRKMDQRCETFLPALGVSSITHATTT